MDASPFAKLARELRDNIYEFVLCEPNDIILRFVNVSVPMRDTTASPTGYFSTLIADYRSRTRPPSNCGSVLAIANAARRRLTQNEEHYTDSHARTHGQIRADIAARNKLSITAVCHEIRAECLPLTYTKNTYHFKTSMDARPLGPPSARSYLSDMDDLAHWPSAIEDWVGQVTERQLIRTLDISTGAPEDLRRHEQRDGFCYHLAEVAEVLLRYNIRSTITLRLTYLLPHREAEEKVKLPLTSAAFEDFVEAEFAQKTRESMRARQGGRLTKEQFGGEQSKLHGRRKFLQPLLKNVAEKLKGAEKAFAKTVALAQTEGIAVTQS